MFKVPTSVRNAPALEEAEKVASTLKSPVVFSIGPEELMIVLYPLPALAVNELAPTATLG